MAIRTIDDFLEQLYQEYKRRLLLLPNNNTSVEVESGEQQHNTSNNTHAGRFCSICQYRHYLPLPLLALCIANSSDATEILMLSYLLANSTFRREMFSDSSNNIGDDAYAYADASSSSNTMEGSEYLAASIFLGMLLGGTLLGFLSDHIGRRPALLTGLVMNATAGFFSSFPYLTPNIALLTMWRFVAGIGIGATVPSLFSLASEWSPKEVRGAVVTFVASFWMVGSLFVSGLAWILFRGSVDDNGDRDSGQEGNDDPTSSLLPMWRIFAAVCAFPSALGAWMVYLYVPESPRFLASAKKKYDTSARVCNQMAGSLGVKLMNDADDDDGTSAGNNDEGDQSEMNNSLLEEASDTSTTTSVNSVPMHGVKPLTEDELRRDYASTSDTDNTGLGSTQTTHTLLDTLQKLYSPQLLTRTTLPLQIIWFSLSFGSYGITTWINTLFVTVHLRNIYFNSFLFALANLPANILSILYSDKWGRKRMLVGSLIGAAAGLGIFALLVYCGDAEEDGSPSQSTVRTYGIVLSACVFQMFSIVSWNAIDILSGELYPTRVRSAGIGVCTACGRFGAMFAQFVNARLMMAGNGEDATSSAYVLAVAASTLLMGAGMPLFLEKDMAMGELKDEIIEEPSYRRGATMGCIAKVKGQKDHTSDDEVDGDFGLRSRGLPRQ